MKSRFSEFPRGVRASLRALGELAYDREMGRLLAKLDGEFGRWREGAIPSADLAESLRRFAQGRTWRDLEGCYQDKDLLPFSAARAILTGILRPDEVSAEVAEALGKHLAFFRQGLEEGTISFEEVGD